MKKILLFIVLLSVVVLVSLSNQAFSQTPQSFKYQTVVRNNEGKALANTLISLRISILFGSPLGNAVYVETFQHATNEFGIASINIGKGTATQGVFASINWAAGEYFIKTEVDITGATNYDYIGTSQLLSVPYALYAENAGKSLNDQDTSATNELQNITKSGNTITLSQGGGTVTDSDNQTINLNGFNLSISDGNTIQLPPDVDHDTINEIQLITKSGNVISLSKNGGSVTDSDNQNLGLNGNQLSITGGNAITLSGVVDLDSDPTNELQTINISNDTIFLSNGGFVKLPQQATGAGMGGSVDISSISNTGDTIIKLIGFDLSNTEKSIFAACGDEYGNIYISGTNESSLNFLGNSIPATGKQVFIAKITHTGQLKWVKVSSGIDNNPAYTKKITGIAVNQLGNIIISGNFQDTITLGTQTLVNSFSTVANKNVFIAMLDSTGNVQWAKQIEGKKDELNSKVDINSNSIVLVCEYKSDTLNFDGNVLYNHNSNNTSDNLIVNYDLSGTIQWYKNLGSISTDPNPDVTITQNGDIFVTGINSIPCYIDTFVINNYAHLIKITPAGNIEFIKSWSIWSNNLSVSSDNSNIYIAGGFSGSPNIFNYQLNALGTGTQMYHAIFDFNGSCIAAKSAGSFSYSYVNNIIAFNGQYFIGAGYTRNFIVESQFITPLNNLSNLGNTYPIILNYNNNGVFQSLKNIKMFETGSRSIVIKTKVNGNYECYTIFGTDGGMLVNNRSYGNGWYLMKY